jgi:hypothetical protein
MKIYCVGCSSIIEARLTTGAEIYPHRQDLSDLPFWKCDTCGNYVGCHHKSHNPTQPLGNIPTPELRLARQKIHRLLDPLWQSGRFQRKQVYEHLSRRFGRQYHTAETVNIEEVEMVLKALVEMETL